MSWSDQDVEDLKKLWLEGHSAGQIARQMPRFSRNAVIGKAHRIGLAGIGRKARLPASKPTRAPTVRPPGRVIAAAREGQVVFVAPAIASGVPVTQRAHVPADRGPRQVQPMPALRHVPGQDDGALLNQLDDRRCRWPIAGLGTNLPLADNEEMRFCGCRRAPGRIYCGDHAALAYHPAPTNSGRSPQAELERSLRRYI